MPVYKTDVKLDGALKHISRLIRYMHMQIHKFAPDHIIESPIYEQSLYRCRYAYTYR